MNRLLALAAVVLVCAATAAAVVSHARGASAARTIDLTGTMTGFRLAVGHKPGAAGDLGYVSGKLYRSRKPSGSITGVCAQIDRSSQQCNFVLALPEGQIILTSGYGPHLNAGPVAQEAIVGGTGAYTGARGQGDDREVGRNGIRLHLVLLP